MWAQSNITGGVGALFLTSPFIQGGHTPTTACQLRRLLLMLESNIWVPALTPCLLHLNQVTLVYLYIVTMKGGGGDGGGGGAGARR